MRLHHTTPCKECPWRKDSLKGYLGGWSVEQYADAVAEGEITACHCRDHGPDSDNTAFCAGAASVMANQCMQTYKQAGAAHAVRSVGKSHETFGHVALFYQYHKGEKWIPRIMRG